MLNQKLMLVRVSPMRSPCPGAVQTSYLAMAWASGRGRFARLGVFRGASWTFCTIGRRFLSPNRSKRPFLSPNRSKRPSGGRIRTPNRRFCPRPPRLDSQSSKTSTGEVGSYGVGQAPAGQHISPFAKPLVRNQSYVWFFHWGIIHVAEDPV